MTAQVPEILIHRCNKLDMCADPLLSYLRRLGKKRRPKFRWTSTACHRGYIATWEIRNGILCLVGIEGLIDTASGIAKADLANSLPHVKDVLPATWFTGRVRCPEGRVVGYVHHGYASSYERDRFFDFDHGRLVGEWLVLNPPEPIIYRIDEEGNRVCVHGMFEPQVLPDPLGDAPVTEARKAWGTPRAAEEDDEVGYVLGGALVIWPPG